MIKNIFTIISLMFIFNAHADAFTLTQDKLRGFKNKKLKLSLNPTNCVTDVNAELDYAIELWNNVPGSRLHLEKDETNSVATSAFAGFAFSQTVVIGCSTNFAAETGGSLQAIGVGTSTMNGTGYLQKGYLILNEEGGQGRYSTQSLAVRLFTVAHEIGHVLGLGHSSVQAALMFASVSTKDDTNLHQDDMDGVIYLYPIDELGDSMMYGCGRVSSSITNLPPPTPMSALYFLILPMMMVLILKRKVARRPINDSQNI